MRSIAPAIWAEVRIEGSFGRSWKTGAPDRVTRLSPLSNLSSHRVIDHHHLTPPPGIAAHVAPTGWPAKLRPYKMIGGCAPQPAQCTRTVGPKYSPPDSFHTPTPTHAAATRPPVSPSHDGLSLAAHDDGASAIGKPKPKGRGASKRSHLTRPELFPAGHMQSCDPRREKLEMAQQGRRRSMLSCARAPQKRRRKSKWTCHLLLRYFSIELHIPPICALSPAQAQSRSHTPDRSRRERRSIDRLGGQAKQGTNARGDRSTSSTDKPQRSVESDP